MLLGVAMASAGSDLDALLEAALVGRGDADAQRAALAALDPGRVRMLEDRLRAVAEYHALAKPGRNDAERLAAAIGIKQRGFFHLLRKVRDHGPVIGLAPYQQRKVRRSVEREGLHPIAEAALADVLSAGETRFGKIVAKVRAAMEDAGLKPPSHDTVRRRIAALGKATAPRNLRVGRALAVVQSRTDVRGERDSGTERRIMTLLIDMDARLILGIGIETLARYSLLDAFGDCERRVVPELVAAGVPFAPHVDAIDLTLDVEIADAFPFDGHVVADAGFDGMSFAAAFRLRAGHILVRNGMPEAVPVTPAVMANAARMWNAEILARGAPRARRDVDDGAGLLGTIRRARERLERVVRLTG